MRTARMMMSRSMYPSRTATSTPVSPGRRAYGRAMKTPATRPAPMMIIVASISATRPCTFDLASPKNPAMRNASMIRCSANATQTQGFSVPICPGSNTYTTRAAALHTRAAARNSQARPRRGWWRRTPTKIPATAVAVTAEIATSQLAGQSSNIAIAAAMTPRYATKKPRVDICLQWSAVSSALPGHPPPDGPNDPATDPNHPGLPAGAPPGDSISAGSRRSPSALAP